MPPWVLFLVFAALFFLMMRSGCGSHAAGHGHRRHRGDSSEEIQAPEKAVDPVCGMTVETRTAKSAVHEGRVFYFCSTTCREKFETSPATYARARPAETSGMEHHHG